MATVFGSCRAFNESNDTIQLCESVVELSCGIETLEEGVFHYTPSMIPVQAFNTKVGKKYIVEADMIEKLAMHENTDITDAFSAVCDENGLMESDVYVLMANPTYAIDEAVDAIIGADDDDDNILMYEEMILAACEKAKAFSEAGVNVIYDPLCEDYTLVTPSLRTAIKTISFRDISVSHNKDLYKKNIEKAIDSCRTYEDYVFVKRRLQREKSFFQKKYPDEESGYGDYSDVQKYLDTKIEYCQKMMKKYESTSKRNMKDEKEKAKNERKRNQKQEKLQRKLAKYKNA